MKEMERFIRDGDGKRHRYTFSPELRHVKWAGDTAFLNVEGVELIETEVHWLVRTDNGHDFHTPKDWYVKQ